LHESDAPPLTAEQQEEQLIEDMQAAPTHAHTHAHARKVVVARRTSDARKRRRSAGAEIPPEEDVEPESSSAVATADPETLSAVPTAEEHAAVAPDQSGFDSADRKVYDELLASAQVTHDGIPSGDPALHAQPDKPPSVAATAEEEQNMLDAMFAPAPLPTHSGWKRRASNYAPKRSSIASGAVVGLAADETGAPAPEEAPLPTTVGGLLEEVKAAVAEPPASRRASVAGKRRSVVARYIEEVDPDTPSTAPQSATTGDAATAAAASSLLHEVAPAP
jgi:hypothetical protein